MWCLIESRHIIFSPLFFLTLWKAWRDWRTQGRTFLKWTEKQQRHLFFFSDFFSPIFFLPFVIALGGTDPNHRPDPGSEITCPVVEQVQGDRPWPGIIGYYWSSLGLFFCFCYRQHGLPRLCFVNFQLYIIHTITKLLVFSNLCASSSWVIKALAKLYSPHHQPFSFFSPSSSSSF